MWAWEATAEDMAQAQGLGTLAPRTQNQEENERKNKVLESLSIVFYTAETFASAQETSTPSLSTLEVSTEGHSGIEEGMHTWF